MVWTPPLTQLRKVLTNLYDNKDDARSLVADVPGLDATEITWSDKPVILWQSIFEEAQKQGLVHAVIDQAMERFGNHTGLQTARETFLNAPPPVEVAVKELVSVGEGLEALIDLLQDRKIYQAIIKFRANLEAACHQIEIVITYKCLHDLLHKLEFRCYKIIYQIAPSFPDDETALSLLSHHEVDVREIADELQRIVADSATPEAETQWVANVVQAQSLMHAALEDLSREPLNQAIRLMGRVLYLQPTRISQRLNAAARALRLADIQEEMSAILSEIRNLELEQNKIQLIEKGTQALGTLAQNMRTQVEEHDNWQAVDLELRRIESLLDRDWEELEMSWPDLVQMVGPLYQNHTEGWVHSLQAESAKLETALLARNPAQIMLFFSRYRRDVGNRFYQVDAELKRLCDGLPIIGEPLAAVLAILT